MVLRAAQLQAKTDSLQKIRKWPWLAAHPRGVPAPNNLILMSARMGASRRMYSNSSLPGSTRQSMWRLSIDRRVKPGSDDNPKTWVAGISDGAELVIGPLFVQTVGAFTRTTRT